MFIVSSKSDSEAQFMTLLSLKRKFLLQQGNIATMILNGTIKQ